MFGSFKLFNIFNSYWIIQYEQNTINHNILYLSVGLSKTLEKHFLYLVIKNCIEFNLLLLSVHR